MYADSPRVVRDERAAVQRLFFVVENLRPPPLPNARCGSFSGSFSGSLSGSQSSRRAPDFVELCVHALDVTRALGTVRGVPAQVQLLAQRAMALIEAHHPNCGG